MNIKQIIKEEVISFNEWSFINDLIVLSEDETSPTFEWDVVKDKIDNTKKNVKTSSQAEQYLITFIKKVESIPKKLKIKMIKYVITGLISILGANSVSNIVSNGVPEIKKEVLMTSTPLPTTPKEKPIVTPKVKEVKYTKPTKVTKNLIDFLKYEEGSRKNKGEAVLKAYQLGDKMVTIGWGHAERINRSQFKKGDVITIERAKELFKADVLYAKDGLDRLLNDWDKKGVEYKIDQDMYEAMISMIFNMGVSGFRGSDFIQIVKRGDYDEAREKIKNTHITYPGHIPRRAKESEMFGKNMDA
jgi:lysozyme